ncbi:MAG: glycosyltransferase 87 family protein [Gemmataceae bacterium]
MPPAIAVAATFVGFLGCLIGIRYAVPTEFGLGDFPIFWSAAVVVVNHGDPYDINQTSQLMEAPGFWNPPFTIPVYYGLGLVDVWLARWIWTGVNLGGALVAGIVFWREFGGSVAKVGVPLLISITFYGQHWNLLMAHVLGLELLGLAGFLYFVTRERPVPAGLCVSLTAFKPHLLLIFALWLLLGATRRSGFIVVVSGGVVLLGGMGVAELMAPGITARYLEAYQRPSAGKHHSMADLESGATGYRLRKLVSDIDNPATFWIQFVPLVLVAACSVFYWLARRRNWDWRAELPVAVWLSALAAPYGLWACDQALLLIPVLQATVRLIHGKWFVRCGMCVLYTLLTLELHTTFRQTWQFGVIALLVFCGYVISMWCTRNVNLDSTTPLSPTVPSGPAASSAC